PGTSFSWTIQDASNVSGASAGSGSVISQVLSTTDGIAQGTVTYRITPESNGCAGTPLDVIVTVNPTPLITTPASSLVDVVCSGTTLNFTPASTIGGTTYTWESTVPASITG